MRRHLLTALFGVMLLSGCTNLSQLAREVPEGDDYYALLSNEYLAYSTAEAEQYDWYDSEYFAKKGLKAAAGINVQPENPDNWDVPSEDYDEIMRQRRRLIALVNGSARDNYPSRVAHTQVLFDCWLEQIDEQFMSDEESVCARKFIREIADIESQILLASPAVPSKSAEKKAYQTVESDHTIFFGFDLTEFGERGQAVISEVASMLGKMTGYAVEVDGYTDTAGPAEYNLKLSKERAQAVADALADEGVDESRITSQGHGETNLIVPTEDDVIERKNRRVEIQVKGKRQQ